MLADAIVALISGNLANVDPNFVVILIIHGIIAIILIARLLLILPVCHWIIVYRCYCRFPGSYAGKAEGNAPALLPEKNPNGPWQYEVYGVACVEVVVDLLTGESQIERADVLLDCGTSLNPAIDAGQVC